jgi:aspartokinase/homoserine dehydrogenase 1
MKGVKVLKFGGTSMGSADAMKRVMAIVRKPQKDARIAAVAVSAMSGTTDQLIKMATLASKRDESYKKILAELETRHTVIAKALVSKRTQKRALQTVAELIVNLEEVIRGIALIKELSPRALDYVMSYGEQLSAHILADALADRGVNCEYLDARNVITTNDSFGEAAVDFKTTNAQLRSYFKKHPALQIVTGFIASGPDKATTTLGRGGSDYTSAILGAALGAHSIEIWTDVSGVYTADPRKVENARPVAAMTYQEAAEMSYFGAKVIHPPTMQPALEKGIPLFIKNTFAPDAPGTHIAAKAPDHGALARGISSVGDIVMLRLEGSGMVSTRGSAGRLFTALAQAHVNVILITQASSQHSISLAVSPKDVERAVQAIEEEFVFEQRTRLIDPVKVRRGLSILAVVGEGMKHRRGIAGRLFQTLGRNGINIVALAQGSSELNISVVIQKEDEMKALNAVHAAFFTPECITVNVFLVGTGVIGSALLKQIAEQRELLEREHGFSVRILGLANATHMMFNSQGIAAHDWKDMLSRSKRKMHMGKFVAAMKEMELHNSVFIDCTASEEIVTYYMDILSAGISIVTPNKCANSGSYERYYALKSCAAKFGVKFLYETNVGAGLPVLSTLRDLRLSGDKLRKIEAVLSGTLSYIFDNFNGTKPFSEIVRDARTLGYAEPDPRNDLSGLDVARKILILSREMGLKMELEDVKVESLLSERARKAPSVEKFFDVLRKDDAQFEGRRVRAKKNGKVLRYIATLNGGKATVGLQAVDAQHPFYALYGNDNIIAFFTNRYKKSPLIVQGPGAGADVTAAGVFADILRTAVSAL